MQLLEAELQNPTAFCHAVIGQVACAVVNTCMVFLFLICEMIIVAFLRIVNKEEPESERAREQKREKNWESEYDLLGDIFDSDHTITLLVTIIFIFLMECLMMQLKKLSYYRSVRFQGSCQEFQKCVFE